MTSLPLDGEDFISPLHESLLNLPEKDDINLKGRIQGTDQRAGRKLSTLQSDKLGSIKYKRRLVKKKVEAADKRDKGSLLKVDTDTETPKGKKLVMLKIANLYNLEDLTQSELRCNEPTDNVASGSMSTSKTGTLPLPIEDSKEDNWVCCDSCKKWRLLPQEWDPDLLPEKWICSMLSCLYVFCSSLFFFSSLFYYKVKMAK